MRPEPLLEPPDPPPAEITLPTPEATTALARALGRIVQPGDVLGLDGPLGAGKTCFVQGLARGLGVPEQVRVTSPSFTLINEYAGRLTLYHIDLYRLEKAGELRELGLWELSESGGMVAAEWLSRFPDALPGDRLQIDLRFAGPPDSPEAQEVQDFQERGRVATLRALGPRAAERLRQWLVARDAGEG